MAALLAGKIAVVAHQPAAALDNAVAQLKKQHPLVTDVAVLAAPATGSSGAFDAVIASSGSTDELAAELETLAPIVKAGGALLVYVAGVSDDNKSSVLMALMIGGFVEAAASSATDIAALFPDLANAQCFSSKKPAFEAGAALSLGKKLSTGTTSALPLKKWTVMADDGDDDDDDIIDEDTLLDDTDEVLQAAKDDCGPGVGGKKRACKNCTCGRKDEDDQPVVSDKDLTQMVSSCGNCFKGDAFRCGSCPFLGKPAFKPGMEKVLLNLDDADDI